VFSIANIPFAKAGMVTDAQWIDLNGDGRTDLALCGEFMPITILINTKEGFKDQTQDYFASPLKGFWFKIQFADVNGDGKPDLIAGNFGQNSQLHASDKEPAELYYADFDSNGSIDPFFNFYLDGKSYPFVSRDEINEQIYPMRRRFSSYKAYADATINEIFTPQEMATASKLSINTTQTCLFINQNGKFVAATLPLQAQFAPVSQILTNDFDHDGKIDMLLLGNHADNRLKIGSMDANYGCLLKGDGKGGFTYVAQSASGLSITGDVKAVLEIQIDKAPYLIIGTSQGPLKFYKE